MTKPSRKRRPWWMRVLVVVALVYAGWCAVLFFAQDSLIFPRPTAGATALPNRTGFEQVWITADDGVRVEGWFFAAPGAGRKGCAVVFHGNGDLIDYQMDYVDFFRQRGMSSMLVEYRGYGRSTPTARPGERAIVADSTKFIDSLGARPDIDPGKLVFIGHSLGSGVAAQVAAKHKPAAIILESPFTSVVAFAAGYGAPTILVRHPFRTDLVLPPLAAQGLPVLIAAGRADEIVPFSHAQRLKELTPSSTLIEIEGSHNDLPLGQEAFARAVDELLRKAGVIGISNP